MIADGGLPAAIRRNYASFGDAYARITAAEGINGLFRGSMAYVIKMVGVNVALTGPYDYLHEKMFLTFGDMEWNKPVAIAYAALWASVCTLPLDNIKTKLMRAFEDPAKNRFR